MRWQPWNLFRCDQFETFSNRFLFAPGAHEVVEAPTPAEFCRRGSRMVAGFNARTFRIWRAFSSAAADDPAIDAELTELWRFISGQCRDLVGLLAARGWLRADVPVDELGDSVWVLIGSDNYDKILVRLGWSSEQYEDWLTRSLADLLFPPG